MASRSLIHPLVGAIGIVACMYTPAWGDALYEALPGISAELASPKFQENWVDGCTASEPRSTECRIVATARLLSAAYVGDFSAADRQLLKVEQAIKPQFYEPCINVGIALGGKSYSSSIVQLRFVIASKLGRQISRDVAAQAFVCEIVSTINFTRMEFSGELVKDSLSQEAFRRFFLDTPGGTETFSVDMFSEQVVGPLSEPFLNARLAYGDPKKALQASVDLFEVLNNAAEKSDSMGLAKSFGTALRSRASWYMMFARTLAK